MQQSGRETWQASLRIGAAGWVACVMVACFGDPTQVQVRLDVTGELVAPAGRDADPVRQPISVAGRFDFIDRELDRLTGVVRARATAFRRWRSVASCRHRAGGAGRLLLRRER